MRIQWLFTEEDKNVVRTTVERQTSNPLVLDRRRRNLSPIKQLVSRERFWRALCMGLLTTQQPSGPSSAVNRILCTKPFPLAHGPLARSRDVAATATRAIVRFGGIRRHGRIGKEIAKNLNRLEEGEWRTLSEALASLTSLVEPAVERRVANYLDETFVGLGPKQARNVLQALGLTRYEIPVDSRVAKWLREHAFPVPVSATVLSDRNYYCFVLDAIQLLCREADVLPCELDGAIFASYNKQKWITELVPF